MFPLDPDPWASGVLKPEVHGRLVAHKDTYAQDAGIQAGFMWATVEQCLPLPAEQAWLAAYPRHRRAGYCGLIYTGTGFDPPIEVRMSGITGALLRNFIRARMMTMSAVQQLLRFEGPPQASCLLLPTFHDAKPEERTRSGVIDLLLSRFNDSKSMTVLYAPSIESVGQAYGVFLRDHIRDHYQEISGTTKIKGDAK